MPHLARVSASIYGTTNLYAGQDRSAGYTSRKQVASCKRHDRLEGLWRVSSPLSGPRCSLSSAVDHLSFSSCFKRICLFRVLCQCVWVRAMIFTHPMIEISPNLKRVILQGETRPDFFAKGTQPLLTKFSWIPFCLDFYHAGCRQAS